MARSRRRGRNASVLVTAMLAAALATGWLASVPAGASSHSGPTATRSEPHAFVPKSGFTVKDPPTAAQVNTAVADGVDYLDCQQDQTKTDSDFGSFDGDVPETAAAIIGYGVLDKGNIANLPRSLDNPACPGPKRNLQTDLTNAVSWLLGQQDTTDPVEGGSVGGSWTFDSDYYTYSTGLALTALGLNEDIPALATKIKAAISLGRGFLATPGEFEDEPPPGTSGGPATCTTTPNDYTAGGSTQDTSYYCGGWNYGPEYVYNSPRSDESNTGYALTGLHLTGGLTSEEAALDLGWQTNDQADTTSNPHYSGSHNDGGASYQPDIVQELGSDFSSNANDSGTLLFSLADDGETIASAQVDKAIQFDTDALDTYEKQANTDTGGPGYESGPHVMVYHDGDSEDGSCAPGTSTKSVPCDWGDGNGEGGFHYSLFTIAKGMGSFIPADLSKGSNWYAKIADLLVNQQDTTTVCTPAQDTPCTFGSWTPDLRDDFSTIFATGLSIFTLGLVATPPPPLPKVTAVAASPVCNEVEFTWLNPSTPNFGGVFIQRSTTGFPATSNAGTRVANVKAPGTTFTDKNLVSRKKYFYALFAHDTSGQAVSAGVDVSATPICAFDEYRMEGGDGGIFDYRARFYGSLPSLGLHIYDVVAMASTSNGYWIVTKTGRVYNFGMAKDLPSLPQTGSTVSNIVGIAGDGGDGGYWLVSSTGIVYPFGNAPHLGSVAKSAHVKNVVAISSPDRGGYWLVTSTGKVFRFGNAVSHGSCQEKSSGCTSLTAPIVAIDSPDAGGYWLVTSSGTVFGFGDAVAHGSCSSADSGCVGARNIVGIASPDPGGYWLATGLGKVVPFGDAKFLGDCAESAHSRCLGLVRPMVAIT